VLHGKITNKNIEERCQLSANGFWLGSEPEHDAKFEGAITFNECHLFVENSKKEFIEQPACEDREMKWEVKGQFWFEGTKAAHGTKIVLLLELKEPSVQEIGGALCEYATLVQRP
jgi:hypothetical protein